MLGRLTSAALLASALALPWCVPEASAGDIDVPCSTPALISALMAANAVTPPGPDTLHLAGGYTYMVTNVDNNWYGPNGLPAIGSKITIEGNGATIVRDPAAPRFRLFFVGANPNAPGTLGYVTPGPEAGRSRPPRPDVGRWHRQGRRLGEQRWGRRYGRRHLQPGHAA
jgi:hypothetical protein